MLYVVTSVCYHINEVIYMSKARTKSKDKYNETAYARYTIRIRKDSDLYNDIESFMSLNGTSLNYLVQKLLTEHFENVEKDAH